MLLCPARITSLSFLLVGADDCVGENVEGDIVGSAAAGWQAPALSHLFEPPEHAPLFWHCVVPSAVHVPNSQSSSTVHTVVVTAQTPPSDGPGAGVNTGGGVGLGPDGQQSAEQDRQLSFP